MKLKYYFNNHDITSKFLNLMKFFEFIDYFDDVK